MLNMKVYDAPARYYARSQGGGMGENCRRRWTHSVENGKDSICESLQSDICPKSCFIKVDKSTTMSPPPKCQSTTCIVVLGASD